MSMTQTDLHASYLAVIKRLRRANGHLANVIAMIENGKPCTNIAQQLHAVEKAVQLANRTLIQDHIDYCLDDALAGPADPEIAADFKTITKYL